MRFIVFFFAKIGEPDFWIIGGGTQKGGETVLGEPT